MKTEHRATLAFAEQHRAQCDEFVTNRIYATVDEYAAYAI